jgi:ribulose-5-phosphate 4-epimerase/fuculose-1-phosphate aldolase
MKNKGKTVLAESLDQLRRELSVANRILAHEGVLDAFGHVSVRHPGASNRFLLSRSRAPELVEPDDVMEFTIDSAPVKPTNLRLYSERVIHGEIYRARPDVLAVCHHHAPAIMPFAITGTEIVPVFHLGAASGTRAPFWDQRDEFGDTNLLVIKPEEGRSLARALGPHWMVLMRRHGATVAGRSLRELVFRTVYSVRNAQYLLQAKSLGEIGALSPGEIERAAEFNLGTGPVERAWEYWATRVEKTQASGSAGRKGAPRRIVKKLQSRKTSKDKRR